ncbi:MAG: magnesium transporter, partial [Nitrospinota bacterium]|nr:magnesium transporter [Nitrospinota bacterium]
MTEENGARLAEIQRTLLSGARGGKPLDELYHPADIAASISRLEDDQSMLKAFLATGVEMGSQILPLLDDHVRELILNNTDPETLAEIIGEMNTDDAADMVGEMEEEVAEEVLEATDMQVVQEVSRLAKYPPETAGGIMQTELLAARQGMTLDEVIMLLRSMSQTSRDVYNVFVVDMEGKLIGVTPIIELLLHYGGKKIGELVDESHPPLFVYADEDQENVAKIFKKYDVISLAVVDRQMMLLGRILIDDIVDVMVEEADEDIMKMAGANDEVLYKSTSTLEMARHRLPWLAASLVGGFLTGGLIWYFQGTLEGVMALATFIPIVMGLSGNVGTQSSTLVVRGMATGRLDTGSLSGFLFKEFMV